MDCLAADAILGRLGAKTPVSRDIAVAAYSDGSCDVVTPSIQPKCTHRGLVHVTTSL